MNITIHRTVNLSAPILPETLSAPIYEGEKNAQTFIIKAIKDNVSAPLSGSVVGYFERADGNTVRVEGEIVDGEAHLTLTQECYMTGIFYLAIMLVTDNAQTAIYAAAGRVKNTQSGEIIDGGDAIPTYDEIMAALERYLAANLSAKVEQTETEVIITLTDADGETQAVIPIPDTEIINQHTEKIDQLSAEMLTKAPAINCEASGSLVSVTDAAAQPAVKLISHIEPVQEGEGDPSPDNVRTISGWDSVTAQRTGKNILPNGGDEKTGGFLLYATDKAFAGAIGREINVSFDLYSPDGSVVSVYAYQQSGLSISNSYDFFPHTGVYERYSFSTSITKYGQTLNPGNISFYSPSSAVVKVKNVQVEFGGTATAYEPYQGKILTASLPETVYGGALDWGTGVLTVTHGNIAAYAGETVGDGWISSTGELSDGAQVVHPLAAPYTVQLTPQQLSTLKGINNVWSNTGNTSLAYVADTKIYIDNKFTELNNAILAMGAKI